MAPRVPRIQETSGQPLRPSTRISPDRIETGEGTSTFGQVDEALDTAGQVVRENEKQRLAREADLAGHEAQQKKFADDMVIRDVELDASIESTKLMNDIRLLRGRESGRGVNHLNTEWRKYTDEVFKSLENDEQKIAVQAILDSKYISNFAQTHTHIAKETEAYDISQTESLIEVRQNEAALNYTSDSVIEDSIKSQFNAIDALAERQDFPPEKTQLMKDNARSATYREALARMLIDGEDDLAKEKLEGKGKTKGWADFINKDHKKIIERVRKEEKARQVDVNNAFLIDSAIKARNGEIDLETWNQMLQNGQIRKLSHYNSIKKIITDVYDDPAIDPLDKGKKRERVLNELIKLSGFDRDENGDIRFNPTREEPEAIDKFVDQHLDPRLFKKAEFDKIVEALSKQAVLAESENMNIFSRLDKTLRTIYKRAPHTLRTIREQVPDTMNTLRLADALIRALPMLSPEVSKETAEDTSNRIINKERSIVDPGYPVKEIGEFIDVGAESLKITDIADDGEYIIEVPD